MVRPQRQLLRLTVAAGVAGLALGGCGVPDNGDAAQAIGTTLRGLPGVADVEVDYRSDFTQGENAQWRVELDPAATVTEARDVARTFVTDVQATDFRDGWYVTGHLDVATSGLTLRPLATAADGGPMPPAVAEDAVTLLWAAIASPAVESVSLTRPQPGRRSADGADTVTLRQPVDTAAAQDLQRRQPALADVDWVLRNPPAESHRPASTWTSAAVVPDAVTQQVWSEITTIAAGDVVLGTYGPDRVTGAPATAVEVRLLAPPDQLARTAAPIAAALARLGRPVELTVGRGGANPVEVAVGGCFRHESHHVESPGEADLARRHERC